jgi:hypothetical protein
MWFSMLFRSCWEVDCDQEKEETNENDDEAVVMNRAQEVSRVPIDSSTIPYLPDEVLQHILEFGAPPPNQRWKWLGHIRASSPRLCNLAKEFAPNEFSLENVFVSDENQVEHPHKIAWSNRFRFLESFRMAPWKASRVIRVKISTFDLAKSVPDEPRSSTEMYLCKVLRWLVYTPGIFPSVQEVHINVEQDLNQVFQPSSSPFVYLARNLPQLSKLTFANRSYWISKQLNIFGEVPYQFTHTLRLIGALGLNAENMSSFFRSRGPDLKVLELIDCQTIGPSMPHNDNPLLQLFDQLYGDVTVVQPWTQLLCLVAKHCHCLEKFSITNANIGDEELSAILRGNPNLVDLDISGCNSLDSDKLVKSLIENAPRLESLRGHGCQWFNDDFLTRLFAPRVDWSLQEQKSSIHTIGIDRTRVTMKGLETALSDVPTLGRGTGGVEIHLAPQYSASRSTTHNVPFRGSYLHFSLMKEFPDVNFLSRED